MDGRNFLCEENIASQGFEYVGIGGISDRPDAGSLVDEPSIAPDTVAA